MVEKIGVERSLNAITEADLIIVVLNNNEELSENDYEILKATKNKQRIIVINKNDLQRKVELPTDLENVIETNTTTEDGIETLKNKIIEMFNLEELKTKDYTYLSNSRQLDLTKKAYQSLMSAENGLENDLPIDMIEIDLKDCFDLLGEIIGITYSDEIIDNLFEHFCVGK